MNNQLYRKLQLKLSKSKKRKRERKQMAFKMSFNKEEFEGPKPILPGLYKFRLLGFKPKVSKKGDSVNFNPIVEIVGGEYDGRKFPYLASLNSGIPSFIQDFVHSFGLPMENQLGDDPQIPGEFAGTLEAPGEYVGPLIGKVAEWEIGMGEYNGTPKNEVRRFVCAVPDCASAYPNIRHSNDMARKS